MKFFPTLFALLLPTSFVFGQLVLEHTYIPIRDSISNSIRFKMEGAEYFSQCNLTTFVTTIYKVDNEGHHVWKQFSPCITSSNYLSQTTFNQDSLLEIIRFYTIDNIKYLFIKNELGDTLFQIKGDSTSLFSTNFFDDKFIVSYNEKTEVYSLPDLILEHTLPVPSIRRISLSDQNIKYYYINYESHSIHFYNEDYSFWKIISMPENISEAKDILYISQNKINEDDLIEVIYYKNNTISVINENNSILYNFENVFTANIDKVEGLKDHLHLTFGPWPYLYQIYEVEGFKLLKEFNKNLTRVNLKYSGEKYYYLIGSTKLGLLNSDFSEWKTVNLDPGSDPRHWSNIVIDVSDVFVDDPDIEVLYSYYNRTETKLSSETNVRLQYISSLWYEYSKIEGLPNKLIAMTYLFRTYNYKVYGPPHLITDVEETFIPYDNIRIYPNPANDILNIKSADFQPSALRLLDINGCIIRQSEAINNEITQMNIQDLPAGMYILQMKNEKGIAVKKFIKQ